MGLVLYSDWEYIRAVSIHWIGPLDWTNGLMVDLEIPQLDEHGWSLCTIDWTTGLTYSDLSIQCK